MKNSRSAIMLIAVLAAGCAAVPEKREDIPSVSTTEATPPPPKENGKESAKTSSKKEVHIEEANIRKPAKGSKFSKLRVGMTLGQVEKLMGAPASQKQYSTNKASIPFYFGPDRWVIKYSYKGEGVLTLNSGGEQLLTQIEVNPTE